MTGKKNAVTRTKNYDLFKYIKDNRDVVLTGAKRKLLRVLLERHGWLDCYPLICARRAGTLFIRDGQHRLTIARELGIAVPYVVLEAEDDNKLTIADIEASHVPWKVTDYAKHYASMGKKAYVELLRFAEQHKIPCSLARSVLSEATTGEYTGGSAIIKKFNSGDWTIVNRDNSERVLTMYQALGALAKEVKTRFMLAALCAVAMIPGFDDVRLMACARRCPEKLMKYGNRTGYLEMLEEIYNFCKKSRSRMPVKFLAQAKIDGRNRGGGPKNKGGKLKPNQK